MAKTREPYHEADAISSGGIKRAHFKSLYDYKHSVRQDYTSAAMRIGNHAHRGLLPDGSSGSSHGIDARGGGSRAACRTFPGWAAAFAKTADGYR